MPAMALTMAARPAQPSYCRLMDSCPQSTEEAHLEESLVGRWDYRGGAAGMLCSEQVLGPEAVEPLKGCHWAWAPQETMGRAA